MTPILVAIARCAGSGWLLQQLREPNRAKLPGPVLGGCGRRALFLVGAAAVGLSAASVNAAQYRELLTEVCSDSHRVDAAPSLSQRVTHFLLDEADRLHVSPRTRELLADRLGKNAFTVTQDELWVPHESFDVALQSRSEAAGAMKAKLSRQRFQEYSSETKGLSEKQRDEVLRAALTILAETGHLPEIVPFKSGSTVQFTYREACVVSDAPGLMTTFMQGRLRELDLITRKLGPPVPLQAEKATLSDPAVAFSSDGAATVRFRTEQLEQAFQSAAAQTLLRHIYASVLNDIRTPDKMKNHLTGLISLVEGAYVITRVNLYFDAAPRSSGGSGYYDHSTRTYIFYLDRFAQILDRYVQRENLDLARSDQRKLARDFIFGELVNNAAHELTHAGQHQWIEQMNGGMDRIPPASRARVADYSKNDQYKNTAWESHTLIGVMGVADYDRYRHQPLEEDAWATGAYAQRLVLQLVVPGKAHPVAPQTAQKEQEGGRTASAVLAKTRPATASQ
jgi:hypothetical protein